MNKPQMSHREAFRELELTEGLPLAEVKAQYRRLAKLWHPDKNKTPGSSARMVRINLAYEVLCQFYSTPFTGYTTHDSGQGFGEGGFGGYGRRYHSDPFNDADPFGGSRPDNDEPLYATRGRKIIRKIKITLFEAVFGCKRTVEGVVTDNCALCGGSGRKGHHQFCELCRGQGRIFTNPRDRYSPTSKRCGACAGSGYRENKCAACDASGQGHSRSWSEQITIPPGAHHQGFVVVKGRGGQSSSKHLHGDLVINIEIIEHPLFMTSASYDVLESDAIGVVVPVSFWTWILGGEVVVPLLQGSRVVTFAAREEVISIPGEGLPCARDPSRRGNLIVELLPCEDTKLSPEHRRMVEQMAKEQQSGRINEWSHAMRDWTFGSTESRFGESKPKKKTARKKADSGG
ncbi:DnaJ C-terminal domain-containing protein [Comamonas thiooxydans]|nr:DnaJ C-terminal domain-containing protein [Comamonas thiooxydans]